MKCLNCGHGMKKTRENYKYNESGLEGITLINIEVQHCTECGEKEALIPSIEELHKTIAMLLTRKNSKLTSKEIRFLRTHLGYSSKDFAETIGVTQETVSRWESETDPKKMAIPTEKLLRLMVLRDSPIKDYSLKDLASGSPKKVPLRLEKSKNGWIDESIMQPV